MLFHYQLLPVDEIEPWTNAKGEDKHLHWFGLTLGHYWIDAKGTELFRYSPEILEHWLQAYPEHTYLSPYVEYQIVCLWEDLIEMLPSVLTPVPDDLAAKIFDTERWLSWTQKVYQSGEDTDDLEQIEQALFWWEDRALDSGHFVHSPRLWFWTVADTVHLRWDNRGRVTENNVPLWTADTGEITMPVAAFIDEITHFDTMFLREMAARVAVICQHGTRPDIRIDIGVLEHEQQERSTWMAYALSRPRNVNDWESIRSAISATDRRFWLLPALGD